MKKYQPKIVKGVIGLSESRQKVVRVYLWDNICSMTNHLKAVRNVYTQMLTIYLKVVTGLS